SNWSTATLAEWYPPTRCSSRTVSAAPPPANDWMGHRASNQNRCFFMSSVTAAALQAEVPQSVGAESRNRRQDRNAIQGTHGAALLRRPLSTASPGPPRWPQSAPRSAGSATSKVPAAMSEVPSAALADQIARTIAAEIGAQPAQARAAIGLLDEGATVPFIARYRKEVTGGLDDTQLRNLEARLTYLRELEDRRAAVLSSIEEQGKLTDALRGGIEAAA